jgi:hypothetical protein
MDPPPLDARSTPADESPEAFLDAIRDHPEWDDRRRDEEMERLVARVPTGPLLAAVRARLGDLGGLDGEVLLRLVEAHAAPDLLRVLAESLIAQPDLPPERAWEGLALLDGAGMLGEFPDLTERWDELAEALDEAGSLDQLAEQLEEDPEGTWLALQGLAAIEPEIRPEIVAGLARAPMGPGLIGFLRLLGFAHDPATRTAALDALASGSRDDPELVAAWASIAADHPLADVSARARAWLGDRAGSALATQARSEPRPLRGLVSALDGRGQGVVALSSERGTERVTAVFGCDVRQGIRDVTGQVDPEPSGDDDMLRAIADEADRDVLEGPPGLALALLAGSLTLCGPETSPALRYWLEATTPNGFRPCPFPTPFPGWDPSSVAFEEVPRRARDVLDACPAWLDGSDLTYELAEEIALRPGARTPDPGRDAGAYRYLFEHRLEGRLELYRRMLFWMATFWSASGAEELGRSALVLAVQLSDAQHVVPGHPFTVALTTRSLVAAQDDLRRGNDPRRPPSPRRSRA